jgi:hypothetical protein
MYHKCAQVLMFATLFLGRRLETGRQSESIIYMLHFV